VHLQGASSTAACKLSTEKPWLTPGGPFLSKNGLRNNLVGRPFPVSMAHFIITPGWRFVEGLIESSLSGVCCYSHVAA